MAGLKCITDYYWEDAFLHMFSVYVFFCSPLDAIPSCNRSGVGDWMGGAGWKQVVFPGGGFKCFLFSPT